jgi:hypothetical protein
MRATPILGVWRIVGRLRVVVGSAGVSGLGEIVTGGERQSAVPQRVKAEPFARTKQYEIVRRSLS